MSDILARIDENRSVWLEGKPPYQPRPPLDRDTRADIAIIGGGFTGMSTAYQLARRFPDKRIVLCEARELANGASGRNGGMMLNWIAGLHSPDAEHAAKIYALTQEGMDLITDTIEEHDLAVPFTRDGSLELFTKDGRAEEEAARVEAYRAAGIPLTLWSQAELGAALPIQGARGAIFDPNAGTLDGVAYLRALRDVVEGLGVVIHEHTPVTKVTEGRRVRLETPGGQLTADTLVLGTGAYSGHLGYFRDSFFPLQSHVVATAPQDWSALGHRRPLGFSDDLDRIAYGSLTARGELVFGGGSNAAYSYLFGGRTHLREPPRRGYAAVERRLHGYLPHTETLPISHRWSGTLSITMSRVCAIGSRGEHDNVLYAFGFSGHGIVMANLAGRVLADIYAGDVARWRDYPFFQPQLWPIPPEPFRWIGYHAVTIATGRSPRRSH